MTTGKLKVHVLRLNDWMWLVFGESVKAPSTAPEVEYENDA